MTDKPLIACIRETSLLTDALVQQYVAAQQIQLDRDFEPAWRLATTLVFVPPGSFIPAGSWQLVFLDHSDQADALGYHTDEAPGGLPRSKVFVQDILNDGLSWPVTASHEVLEMRVDPMIDQTVTVGDTVYAKECADAPEDDEFAYPINGVHMSDFVLPSWFDPAGVAPFTFRRNPQITAPFMLADGGYIGVRTLPDGAWGQRTAAVASARQVKGPTSRTVRRFNEPT